MVDASSCRRGGVIAALGIVFLVASVLGVRALAALNAVLALCWLALAVRVGRLGDRRAAAEPGPGPARRRRGPAAMPPGDAQRGAARIATISALIVVASFVAGKAARDAILLARFDIESLPIFVAVSAVISLPIILVAGRLMARLSPARLIPVLNTVSAALAVGEWLVLGRYPRPIAVVVFFHFAISGAVLVSGFWSIVNERFDVQSAKRHISRIGIGATLGGIAGGVIAERAAVYLAPDAILLVLAALQLACAATLYAFAGVARHRAGAVKPPGAWRVFRTATRSPLLRGLCGIVVLGATSAGVLDYVFKADLVHASSHDGVLRALATFYTVTSVITAIVQAILSGPVISRLGVAKSVATLPIVVTVFGALAAFVRAPIAAAVARGAETVTRNSTYRVGYELIYAPLLEDDKRMTKVVLDVGAGRVGDLVGAQLVALLVYGLAEPRSGLLIAVVCVGAISVILALRIPRSYTAALEGSLLAHASDPPQASPLPPAGDATPWITLSGPPTLGQAGELAALSLRHRHGPPACERVPRLAAWGLWRALDDPSFEVRYRAGAGLARLAAAGHLRGISREDVFDVVRRELVADRCALAGRDVLDDLAAGDPRESDALAHHADAGLEHVFTVLGLALPAEPLRIALHAVQTGDPELRGTALEYLESILPPDLHARLWPLLEGQAAVPGEIERPAAAAAVSPPARRARRPHDEILAALRLSYPTILDKLRQRVKPA